MPGSGCAPGWDEPKDQNSWRRHKPSIGSSECHDQSAEDVLFKAQNTHLGWPWTNQPNILHFPRASVISFWSSSSSLMRFLIELYGFPLRTTDLAVSGLNHSKLWDVSPVKGEPSPLCPGHEPRQLLLAPLPPSHKAEGQPRNYVKHPSCKGKPVECTLPKLKTKPRFIGGTYMLVSGGERWVCDCIQVFEGQRDAQLRVISQGPFPWYYQSH